jgi:hypothetical protein
MSLSPIKECPMELSENETICCDKCNKAFEQGDVFECLLIKLDGRFREVRFHKSCSPLKLPDFVDDWYRNFGQSQKQAWPAYPSPQLPPPISVTPGPIWGTGSAGGFSSGTGQAAIKPSYGDLVGGNGSARSGGGMTASELKSFLEKMKKSMDSKS